jgi:hypothetical protein
VCVCVCAICVLTCSLVCAFFRLSLSVVWVNEHVVAVFAGAAGRVGTTASLGMSAALQLSAASDARPLGAHLFVCLVVS